MSLMVRRNIRIAAAVLAGIGLVLLAVVWAGTSNPVQIFEEVAGADIQFALDDSVVLSADDCVTARWDVENVRTVRFNGLGVIGQDERELCTLEATLEVLLHDGTEASFRLERRLLVETLPGRILLSLAIFCFLLAFYWLVPGLSCFATRASAARKQRDGLPPGSAIAVVCLLVLSGAALRSTFLNADMRTDEAWTFNAFVSRPLAESLSDYSTTNNHLLHTVLVHISYQVFGNEPWALRLPAFFAGVFVIAATYRAGAVYYSHRAGLLAAALVSASSYMVAYSTNARGYTLMTACFLVLLTIAPSLFRRRSRALWLLFVALTAAGLYVVPTMAFAAAIIGVWLLLAAATARPNAERFRRLMKLSGAVGFTALLTALLYLPALAGTFGSPDTSEGVLLGHLRALDLPRFMATITDVSALTWALWNRDLPMLLTLALAVGCVVTLVCHRWLSRQPVSLPLATVLTIAALVFVQFGRSYARLWLFLLPLYFLFGTAGILFMLRWLGQRLRIARPTARQPTMVYAAALVLAAMLSLEVAATQSPRLDGETGGFEPVAVTLFLREHLRDGDFVLCSQSCNQLIYYFNYFGLNIRPGNVQLRQFQPDRVFIIVVNSRQVIWELLRFGVDDETYTDLELLQTFPHSDVFLVERRS